MEFCEGSSDSPKMALLVSPKTVLQLMKGTEWVYHKVYPQRNLKYTDLWLQYEE